MKMKVIGVFERERERGFEEHWFSSGNEKTVSRSYFQYEQNIPILIIFDTVPAGGCKGCKDLS